MIYIDSKPSESGAYPNPKNQPFPGSVALTDEQAAVFFEYNGFVIVTQVGNTVTVKPNVEAWEAWKASLPEPEPEPEPETSVWDELDAAWDDGFKEGVDSV